MLQGKQGYVRDGSDFEAAGKRMRPRVCICCGEAISERGNELSRNPNICASCSSLADGMDDSDSATPPDSKTIPFPTPIAPQAPAPADTDHISYRRA